MCQVLFKACLVLGVLSWIAPEAIAADARPNIVILVADDLGYADIGCHGGKEIPTPHIDSIASAGVRCTSGYVSGPYCSPTRAGLMTGRYQQRFGHEFNPGPPTDENANFGLSLKETTLPQRLKDAGYATGMVGKWHLGHKEEFHPLSRGFQEYYGFLGGSHTYFNQMKKPNDPILRGREPIAEPEYLTDAFSREAVSYIDRHQKEPFFLYMTFNAVHTPLDATDKYLDRFKKIDDPKRRAYAAMLAAMDDAIGAILGKLKATGIDDNTMVFFISDNGGPTAVNTGLNAPLSGVKAQTAEGGIRVPYLVQWKKKLPAGKTYDRPVIQLDIHSTILAAAGIAAPKDKPLDGVDIVPYLTGQATGDPHQALYWRFGQQMAIRMGDYKLVRVIDGVTRLHNLTTDIGEKIDLSESEAGKKRELEAAYAAWNAQLVEPTWKANVKKSAERNSKPKKKAT